MIELKLEYIKAFEWNWIGSISTPTLKAKTEVLKGLRLNLKLDFKKMPLFEFIIGV